uniref:GST N-terminal domain-containing protein n=1 Tax=Glossina brevipalpis TaxID=37001 RepID=A0A1A9WBP5_9MUSC
MDDPTSALELNEPSFEEDVLVLYMHPYNFYSQKILLLLYEKNIEFTPYVMDLLKGEQYSKWFLNLNPKADVPVLKDHSFVVTDSQHIINYIENKFCDGIIIVIVKYLKNLKKKNLSTGIYKSLKPFKINSLEFNKLQMICKMLAPLPIGALSLGSFIHEADLKLMPKPPFVGPLRKACLRNNEKVMELLKQSLLEADANRASLIRKLEIQERRKRFVHSRSEYQKILDAIHSVLEFVEHDMMVHSKKEWLINNDFTMADLAFGLLLLRLYQLGFENYYWSYGKLPNIESYFLRFKKRSACQKLMPSNFEFLRDIWQMTPSKYKIGTGAGVLGMAMVVAFAHK